MGRMDSLDSRTEIAPFHDSEPPTEKTIANNLSTSRAVVLIAGLNATVTVGAINTGMMTVLLPHMAEDLHMSRSLLLWPALIYSLTCGCTLLLSGSIADIVGNRTINLAGTFGSSLFILAVGLAKSSLHLIIFRAFQGIGISMCFPTSVSILSAAFPTGRVRNIAFGCLGLGTPLGFAIGILIGGWFQSTRIGWRPGFYFTAGVPMMLFIVNYWVLPCEKTKGGIWSKLRDNIDWIGVLISSTCMGLLSYALALMSGNISSLREPTKALLLILALATIPLFILWMHVQEMRGRPALIPNSLWRNPTFSAICVMVFLSWATLQGMEWFLSLFYQNVQHLSPIEAAVRYMPNIAAGSSLNVVTGLIIHRVPVNYYVVIISGLCTLAPLLMAIIHVDWSFWLASFWVMFLLPTSVDVNFTVANLVITDIFPKETQALAGAVYQTTSQFGISIGIAVLAVISNTVTDHSPIQDKDSPEALMQGFRAIFWTCFAMMVISTIVGMWGLRGRKKIGEHNKTEESTPEIKRWSSTFGGAVERPSAIKRKTLPLKSGILTSSMSPLTKETSSVHDSMSKPLPQLPGLKLPTVEVTDMNDTLNTLGLEGSVTLDHILELYDRGRLSLSEGHDILNEYYSREI